MESELFPRPLHRLLQRVAVTSHMYRVRHSVHCAEHDGKHGVAPSLLDRCFGTCLPQSGRGHRRMTIGLGWPDDRPIGLGWSLLRPLRNS